MTIELSIIVPAYNEENRIKESLSKILEFTNAQSYSSEIIVVDDGSTDKTSDVVKEFIREGRDFYLLRHQHNKGKGAAVNTGFKEAHGKYLLFSDADLSTPIEEVSRLLDYLKAHETGLDRVGMVIASRRVKGAKLVIHQPIHRELSGRIFSLIVQFIAVGGFLDTQCGFKLFTADVAKKIVEKQTIFDFGFDVEMIYIALKKLKVGVKELPVTWADSAQSRVMLVRDSIQMFLDLIKIRLNNLLGRYAS